MYKKIAIACATLAAAGLLFTGCASKPEELNLRQKVYKNIRKLPTDEYSTEIGDCTVTVRTPNKYHFDLEVEIKNKYTNDTLTMVDEEVFKSAPSLMGSKDYNRGVDIAEYNGISNGLEGMDERFDEALRNIDLPLEQKIIKEVHKVKERTKLN